MRCALLCCAVSVCVCLGLDVIAEGPFKGHRWARPSVEHLRALMRWVYEDPEEAALRGQRARATMVERYCPACVARLALQELSRVARTAQLAQHSRVAAVTTGEGEEEVERERGWAT